MLFTYCLEWPIRINLLFESPAKGLVLKTESYAQRLTQGYSA